MSSRNRRHSKLVQEVVLMTAISTLGAAIVAPLVDTSLTTGATAADAKDKTGAFALNIQAQTKNTSRLEKGLPVTMMAEMTTIKEPLIETSAVNSPILPAAPEPYRERTEASSSTDITSPPVETSDTTGIGSTNHTPPPAAPMKNAAVTTTLQKPNVSYTGAITKAEPGKNSNAKNIRLSIAKRLAKRNKAIRRYARHGRQHLPVDITQLKNDGVAPTNADSQPPITTVYNATRYQKTRYKQIRQPYQPEPTAPPAPSQNIFTNVFKPTPAPEPIQTIPGTGPKTTSRLYTLAIPTSRGSKTLRASHKRHASRKNTNSGRPGAFQPISRLR